MDLGALHVDPLACAVHTIFIYIFKKIESKKNKIHLLEAFTLLSSLYKDEKFTRTLAVDIPNEIVYDIIPFNEKPQYDIMF